jgi:hypothetical protein
VISSETHLVVANLAAPQASPGGLLIKIKKSLGAEPRGRCERDRTRKASLSALGAASHFHGSAVLQRLIAHGSHAGRFAPGHLVGNFIRPKNLAQHFLHGPDID